MFKEKYLKNIKEKLKNCYLYEVIMKRLILFGCLKIFVLSCTKVPKNFIAPQVKFEITNLKENEKKYKIYLEAALRNENQFAAFVNIKGKAQILNKSGNKIMVEIPITIPVLFPLTLSRFKFDKEVTAAVMTEMAKEFKIDEKLLESSNLIDDANIEDKNIVLKELVFEKKDIIDLLEGKLNEKNK